MEAWRQFLSGLEQELGSDVFEKWVKDLKVVRFDAANLYLEARDSFQIAWFEEHIRPRLKGQFFNNNQRPIKIHLGTQKKEPAKKEEYRARPLSIKPDPIDAEMALENFVPSPQNLVVYKLICESAETPSFNPIYLYGPKGVGKTHLLMGAATQLQKKGKRVFFAKAETFTEHVVQAIRLGQMQDFRKIYRDIDVLIVDDIHIFSRKNATQEEFFHTFNALHTMGRLVLLSANAAPSQLNEIEPRLVSRFEWGIALGLEKGEMKPILEKKGAMWKIDLSPDLTAYLLQSFRDPVLALQALALRSRGKEVLNRDIASRLLADLLEKEGRNVLTPEKVIKAIAAHYGIKSEDLLGKSQMRECALPRQVAMYLCRERLKMPYLRIGEFFKRDHSTVMSSVRQIQKGIDEKKSDLIEAVNLC